MAKKKPLRREPDWPAIKDWYESNPAPLYRCVEQHGSTEHTIKKRAVEGGWVRCPAAESRSADRPRTRKVEPGMIDAEAAKAGLPALTEYEHAFVQEYMVDWNATDAIFRAGYVPPADSAARPSDLASTAAAHLKAKPQVAAWIAFYQAKLAKRCGYERERILNELGAVAFVDPISFFDPKSITYQTLEKIPAEDRRAIKEMKITVDTRAGTQEMVLKLHDKTRALTQLGLYQNLFNKFTHLHKTEAAGEGDATGTEFEQRLRRRKLQLNPGANGNGGQPAAGDPARAEGGAPVPANGSGKTVH